MSRISIEGKSYPSMKAACKAYNISVCTVRARRKNGMGLIDALTTPLSNCTFSKDHLGNTFRSFSAMCAYWGVSRDLVHYRLNVGWNIEKALTTKSQRDPTRWAGMKR